jgi:hypothetical protein
VYAKSLIKGDIYRFEEYSNLSVLSSDIGMITNGEGRRDRDK